jgi:UDP-N-acetylmuramate dehydrogenase
MRVQENVDLSQYTSLKIGGIAQKMFFVETVEDIFRVYYEYDENEIRVIGGGSNLLINDSVTFPCVISLRKFDKRLELLDDDTIYCSAANNIQKLLVFTQKNNLGGAEYLHTLPATVGGIVAMNAGRGKSFNKMISDFIETVEVIIDGKFKILTNKECGFGYRKSIFQEKNCVIIGAVFKFKKQEASIGLQKLKERTQYSREKQDVKMSSAGSVFKTYNRNILRVSSKLDFNNNSTIHFSKKTGNWINNGGKGTFSEAMLLINRTKLLHKILLQKCELEWVIWE